MELHEQLLLENKAWAQEMVADNPEFFNNLVDIQQPDFLWIGCSDSRVPANQITGTQPGQIFVHRNIANLVVHTDLNMLSVVEYAVQYLKVKHIIVCGHYGCGGVKAAMGNHTYGNINKWLRYIKDIQRLHREELDKIKDEDLRCRRLVELNVEEQLLNLAHSSAIQRVWKTETRPHLHGWVYDLQDGLLRVIKHLPPKSALDPIYEFDDL